LCGGSNAAEDAEMHECRSDSQNGQLVGSSESRLAEQHIERVAHGVQRWEDEIGGGEVQRSSERVRHGDAPHAGGLRGGDSVRRVFQSQTRRRAHVQALGARRTRQGGLPRHVVPGDDDLEVPCQTDRASTAATYGLMPLRATARFTPRQSSASINSNKPGITRDAAVEMLDLEGRLLRAELSDRPPARTSRPACAVSSRRWPNIASIVAWSSSTPRRAITTRHRERVRLRVDHQSVGSNNTASIFIEIQEINFHFLRAARVAVVIPLHSSS
jgi:hypothetical protein